MTPRRSTEPRTPRRIELALAQPFAAAPLFEFLALRAVPGIEAGDAWRYRRSLRLEHGPAILALERPPDGAAHVACTIDADPRDAEAALDAVACVCDLAADPGAVDERLGGDALLAPLVARTPGLRSPGTADGAELAVRAVFGQQVSVAAARTIAGRIVHAHGEPLANPAGELTHVFPAPATLAQLDPSALAMPGSRGRAVVALAAALAAGTVDLRRGADPDAATAALLALPGIGPWTAAYVRMRALGDRDVFLATDLGVRRALRALGTAPDARSALAHAARWTPFRSHGLHHLWMTLAGATRAAA